MSWREMVSDKLMSPAEAVQAVKSGDQVAVAAINCTPLTLCQALYERRAELSGVRIDHPAPLFPWVQPGDEGAFTLHDLYATPADRQMVNAGRVEYRPVARWKTGLPPDGFVERPDVYMLPVSPPDRHGYCSFGPGVFFSPSFCRTPPRSSARCMKTSSAPGETTTSTFRSWTGSVKPLCPPESCPWRPGPRRKTW